MSEERLIIPKRPQHHKHRFVAAVAVCGLAVLGVWGWQMKMTFDRYAADRAALGEQREQALTEVGERLDLDENAAAVKEGVDEIQALIEQIAREEMAKEQVLDEVKQEMGEMTTTPEAADQQGVVAGETTEAN